MAKKSKAAPKSEPAHESVNVDKAVKANYVKRWVEIEQRFNAAKEERKDLQTDLSAEIKSGFERHGVDVKEVKRLAAIALDEQKARDHAEEMNSDLDEWDKVRAFDRSLEDDDV